MNLGDPFLPVVNTTHDDYCTSGSITDRSDGIAVVYIGSRTAVIFLLIVRFVEARGSLYLRKPSIGLLGNGTQITCTS